MYSDLYIYIPYICIYTPVCIYICIFRLYNPCKAKAMKSVMKTVAMKAAMKKAGGAMKKVASQGIDRNLYVRPPIRE